MKVINVIGSKGEGKTWYVHNKILPNAKQVLVYDLYNEYRYRIANTEEDIIYMQKRRVLPHKMDFKELLHIMENDDFKNNLVILEDCTIYMDGHMYHKDIRKLLVAARHTNNTIVMLWHSLDDFIRPRPVFINSDYVVLYKTIEPEEHKLYRKFKSRPQLLRAYEEIQKRDVKNTYKVIKLR